MSVTFYRGHIIKRGEINPSKSGARGAFYIYHADRPDVCLGVRFTEEGAETRVDYLLNRPAAHSEQDQ